MPVAPIDLLMLLADESDDSDSDGAGSDAESRVSRQWTRSSSSEDYDNSQRPQKLLSDNGSTASLLSGTKDESTDSDASESEVPWPHKLLRVADFETPRPVGFRPPPGLPLPPGLPAPPGLSAPTDIFSPPGL